MIQVVKNGIKWKNCKSWPVWLLWKPLYVTFQNFLFFIYYLHLNIDVNESHCNSETYIFGCRCKIFSIKYGCLSLKAKNPYSLYEKLPWKQKSCHIILFSYLLSKDCELPKRMAK